MKKKIVTFIVILIAVLAIFSLYLLQRNVFSKEVVRLEIFGPEEVDLGKDVEYIVKYKNNGSALLEAPILTFEFPKYSQVISDGSDVAGVSNSSSRHEIELRDIYPGEERTVNFKARLLGKEGEAKTARVSISYQPKNLAAKYEQSNTFTTIIKSIPISFDFDMSSKVDSGKMGAFRLNYFSSLDYPLSDIMIRAEYPSGFEFRESQPRAFGNNEWQIPLLNKAEGGSIVINGILNGEVGESKIFRANLGVWQGDDFVVLKEATRGVEIAQSSVFISQTINGSADYVANPGDYLHYEIFFKNTGDQVLENLFMTVQLPRELFDLSSMRSDSGQIQQDAGSIIFDHTNVSQLKFLAGGEEGKVEFWARLKQELPRNPIIRTRVSVGLAREEFANKINTSLSLSQRGFFHESPIQNTGPLPPQVGQTTTYTVLWQINNSSNDVRSLKVRAMLPSYVRLTGDMTPKDAHFSFDSFNREIVWDVGDLPAGAGSSPMIFQIAFTPIQDQKGQSPELLTQVRVVGEDAWTGRSINNNFPGLNTVLPNDPSVSKDQGVVQ